MEQVLERMFPSEELPEGIVGLDQYTKPNVYRISADKQQVVFSTLGITLSCRFHPAEEFLNPKWCNKFVGEVQYDYQEPGKEDSYEVVKSGTYGEMIFAKSVEEAIDKFEKLINSKFVWQPFNRDAPKVKSKLKIIEVAELAFLHNRAMWNRDKKDFWDEIIANSPVEKREKLAYMTAKYENRTVASNKYKAKIDKVFVEIFGDEFKDCIINYDFNLHKFASLKDAKMGELKSKITDPKEISILKHMIRYYNPR